MWSILASISRTRLESWLAVVCVLALPRPSAAQEQERRANAAVKVHGARLAHAERTPSVASSVVHGAELHAAGQSSADVLAKLPGVQVTRTGSAAELSTASIRGADAEQVPVYLAGIRLNDDVSGTADLSTLPLWMMDRVEVFRGNAPEEADRLGPGGAIMFWPRLPSETRAGLGFDVGSFGARSGFAALELGDAKLGALVALRASGADNDYPFIDDRGQRFDLEESERRRQNADHSQLDAWYVQRIALGAGVRMTTLLNGFEREQGVTGLSVIPARAARARSRRWLFGNTVGIPCGVVQGCRVELSTAFVSGGSTISDPLVELTALRTRELASGGERGSQALRLELKPALDLQLSATASFAADNLRVDRQGTLPRRGQRRSLVPRLGATYQLTPAFAVHALAGAECHWTRGVIVRLGRRAFLDSGPCGVTEPVGRLGWSHELGSGLTLLANVSRYVRMPTLSELYGTAPLVDGNPTLLPERGYSGDAGMRWSSHGRAADVALEAFAFARSVDQIIRYRRSGVDSLAPVNVTSARVLGAEWAASLELLRHARLELSGTVLDPRETTDDVTLDPTVNDVLPYTARLSSFVRLELFETRPTRHLDRAAVAVSYLHKSSRFTDSAGQGVLPAQHLVDVELGVDLSERSFMARLACRNLLDSRTSDVVGLPVPGRSFHAAAEAWF